MTSQESVNIGKNPSFTALNQFDIGGHTPPRTIGEIK
jgi:hypothetical protein